MIKQMKLTEAAKPELWRQGEGFLGMCEHIARCAAICYNSTPKTGGEAVDFVRRLVKMGHGRALEFGTVIADSERVWDDDIFNSAYSRRVDDGNERFLVATNLRVFIEHDYLLTGVEVMMNKMAAEDVLVDTPDPRPTIHYPAISRAIADEFRTHTTLSTLMQSTRYVNAMKGGDMEFIKPSNFDEWDESAKMSFMTGLLNVKACYVQLKNHCHLKSQDARHILPLCVKTEMVQCGFIPAWENFLNLRTAKDAHPDARWMAREINKLLTDYSIIHK